MVAYPSDQRRRKLPFLAHSQRVATGMGEHTLRARAPQRKARQRIGATRPPCPVTESGPRRLRSLPHIRYDREPAAFRSKNAELGTMRHAHAQAERRAGLELGGTTNQPRPRVREGPLLRRENLEDQKPAREDGRHDEPEGPQRSLHAEDDAERGRFVRASASRA